MDEGSAERFAPTLEKSPLSGGLPFYQKEVHAMPLRRCLRGAPARVPPSDPHPRPELPVADAGLRGPAARARGAALACAEPRVCRFRFDTGTSAPGALIAGWELAGLLDELPPAAARRAAPAPLAQREPGLARQIRLCEHLAEDFHLFSSVPCLAHTFDASPAGGGASCPVQAGVTRSNTSLAEEFQAVIAPEGNVHKPRTLEARDNNVRQHGILRS